ncbi:CAAX amino protease [Reticulibacter mediterranei]|uniref:CAAX amino protease n=1 Tax=Reticulibacter mediterranei TaxID=2778369 RepID=A0A8J3N423_9CHLR|nr:CPBP family intramembrane glutamic endopeptidase [Reticulibacter mediterranei]GHO97644.1 CAAX amino protease [Reticulibacter mediterranei]
MSITSFDRPAIPASGGIRGLLQRYPLVCFFAMAYGFSWLGWLPYILSLDGLGILPFRLPLGDFSVAPGAYLGPLLSGFLMVGATEGKAGVRHLWRRMIQWRMAWYWYIFALICTPLIRTLGAVVLPGVLGTVRADGLQASLSTYLILLPAAVLISGLAEEPGWRGFALPRLQERFGPLLGTIILGVLWSIWHFPLFLTSWTTAAGLLPLIEFTATATAIAIIITWVFNNTRGSLLIAMLLHGAVDAYSPAVLFADPQLNTTLHALIGFGMVALLLIVLTRGRLSYQRLVSSVDAHDKLQNV